MKALTYKIKGAVALALAMSLFCPQVFAAEALSAEEQGVAAAPVAEEVVLPKLTLNEALAKARNHNVELKNIEDSLDMLQKREESIDDAFGSVHLPTYDYEKWTDDWLFELYNGVYQIEQGKKQAKLGKELQNLILETTVKTYFTTIISIEDGLELARENAAMQKKAYEQGYTKYRLGMLSKYNLDQLKIASDKAKNSVTTTEAALEQVYITFNDLIGEGPEERFEFVYDVTFAPYELEVPMDQYISNKMKDDIMIQMEEMTADAAKFKANYRGLSNTSAVSIDSDKLALKQAERDLRTVKSDKETLIRNTYLKIKALETDYASAEADLKKAQADYRVAQLSYETGNATKMAVQGAEMGVTAAENALKGLAYEHDMLVYQFENPSILFDTTAQQ